MYVVMQVYCMTDAGCVAGCDSRAVHQGELVLVPLPQGLQAWPVPGNGGVGSDRHHSRRRLPQPFHSHVHQPAHLPAVQSVRGRRFLRLMVHLISFLLIDVIVCINKRMGGDGGVA